MAGKREGGPVGNADMKPDVLKWVDVTIAAATCYTLHTKPVTLVAAPPANDFLMFLGARVSFIAGPTATGFSGLSASNDPLTISYTNAAGQACGTLTASSFLNGTSANDIRLMYPTPSATFTPVLAAALVVSIASGDLSAGDCYLIIRTFYRRMKAGY